MSLLLSGGGGGGVVGLETFFDEHPLQAWQIFAGHMRDVYACIALFVKKKESNKCLDLAGLNIPHKHLHHCICKNVEMSTEVGKQAYMIYIKTYT